LLEAQRIKTLREGYLTLSAARTAKKENPISLAEVVMLTLRKRRCILKDESEGKKPS